MPNYDDPKWRCCFCCHVTRGALIVAWISVVLCIISSCRLFVPYGDNTTKMFIFFLSNLVLPLVGCLPIIVGELRKKRKVGMYLPYLFINAFINSIWTVLSAFYLVVSLAIFFLAAEMDDADAKELVYPVIMAFTLWLSSAIGWCFFFVVFQAYKYAKEEEEKEKQYNGGQKYVSKS